jgi:hypothetical protein
VIRRKMKHRVDAVHRGARHARLAQIRMQEIHFPGAKMPPDIAQVSAREIIDDSHSRTPRQ